MHSFRTWNRQATLSFFASFFVMVGSQLVRAETPSEQNEPQSQKLVVERMKSGFAVAPDFKFTEVNRDFAQLAGAYGGWLMDQTLLIGAGAYWLTNGSHDFEMAYGGPVVEWFARPSRFVNFSIRGLVGGGSGTLAVGVDEFGGRPSFGRHEFEGSRRWEGAPEAPDYEFLKHQFPNNVVVHEGFFIAEPQANVLFNVAHWLRLGVGASYRLIAGASGLEDRFRGATGNFSVLLGSF